MPPEDIKIRYSSVVPDRNGTPISAETNRISERQADGLLALYEFGIATISSTVEARRFQLDRAFILSCHAILRAGLPDAGRFRQEDIIITNSKLRPVGPQSISAEIDDFCDYMNRSWASKDPIFLASYSLWRLLWIHPFRESNGSVARMLSYIVLSVAMGTVLPGAFPIPAQIPEQRERYYRALEYADDAWSNGMVDVSAIEAMLTDMLSVQLAS